MSHWSVEMGPLGLLRLALVRLRRRWSLALTQGLGIAAAVGLTSVIRLVHIYRSDGLGVVALQGLDLLAVASSCLRQTITRRLNERQARSY